MKLFMFYVGGDCGNSNVELHDVRFSIGSAPEDCYEDLRRQWWGTPTSLHLDCWGPVEQADGFDVTLTAEPLGEQAFRLFFVNLGGYNPLDFCRAAQERSDRGTGRGLGKTKGDGTNQRLVAAAQGPPLRS
jgi:hypothetical protein